MQTRIHQFVVFALLAGPCCALTRADGGQLRASQEHGDLRLTVFTSPNPLRAGPIDVSVLVQNSESGRIVDDATIVVELTSPDHALPPLRAIASADAATNQLFRAALFDLPTPGEWNVRVECTTTTHPSPAAVDFTMNAAAPLPPWLTVWPWFTWPIVAVLLFAIHRVLVKRRQTRRELRRPARTVPFRSIRLICIP